MLDCNHIHEVLATSILETLSPTRCVVCDAPDDILCPACARELPYIDLARACPRCGAPYGRNLCTECPLPGSEAVLDDPGILFPFAAARSALSFEGGARKIVRTYKDQDELRLDAVIASLVCNAMRGRRVVRLERADFARPSGTLEDWTQWAGALVYVPASPEAVLRRGFDHMQRVARLCSKRTGVPLADLLECCKRTADQRDLGRSERLENRDESFRVRARTGTVPGKVILIDDVFTTGATLSAATQALLDAGSLEVRTVSCARVW